MKKKTSSRSCKIRTEAYTYTLGLLTHSLTHWLTHLSCPHNAFKNFAIVENSYSGQTLTRFQAASHLASALFGGNNLDHVYLKGHMKSKTTNLCKLNTMRTSWKSPTWRKKIWTRSLAEAKLEQFCYGFICLLQV